MSEPISSIPPDNDAVFSPVPPAPPKPFPGFGQALLLLALIHVIANLVAFLIVLPGLLMDYLANGSLTKPMIALAAVGIVANSIGFAVVTWFTWWRSRLPAREAFSLRRVSPTALVTAALLLGGTLVVVDLVSVGLFILLPPPDIVMDVFAQLLGSEAPVALSVIFLVIVAPVTEEFFFRGVLQRSLSIRYGPRPAILLSGLLFGLVHVLPWQVVPAMLLGTLFAWWTERTGSIWPALIAHAVNNGTAFVLSRLHPEKDPLVPEWPEPLFLVGGALFLIAGFALAGRWLVPDRSRSVTERSFT